MNDSGIIMVRKYLKFSRSNNTKITDFTVTDRPETPPASIASTSESGTASTSGISIPQEYVILDTDSDDSAAARTPEKKKMKLTEKRKCKFQSSWIDTFENIGQVHNDVYSFRCLSCCKAISCSHMGVNDVKRHLASSTHKEKRKKDTSQTKLQEPSESIVAELRAANMIAKHNLPLSFGDSLSRFVRSNFSKDDRSRNFTCGRTKTTALVNTLGQDIKLKLVEKMRKGPFAIYTDGSNDNNIKKMMPLTISVINPHSSTGISTEFYDMGLTQSTTAEAMFDMIESTLKEDDISLDNCVAIALDNTNANMGCNNSLRTRMEKANPSIYVVGCVCHILHNAGGHGCKILEAAGIDIQEMLSDIYNHFKNSSPRKQDLKEFCDFCNVEFRQILKHIRVRWLSLNTALERVLKLYAPLRSYFLSSDLRDTETKRLKVIFNKPITEVYLWAVHSFTCILVENNLKLQTGHCMVHKLYNICEGTLRSCLSRFCELDGIDASPKDLDVPNLPKKMVNVGMSGKFLLRQLLSSGDVSEQEVETFQKNVTNYMETVSSYLSSHLPLHDEYLMSLKWINPTHLSDCKPEVVQECALRYRKVLQYSDSDIDRIDDEWPNFLHSSILTRSDDFASPSQFWTEVSKDAQFSEISRVALLLCLIPHSNAVAERIFSMIGKNLTASRKSLRKDTTLTNIMLVKCADLDDSFLPSDTLKKAAKSAVRLSLQD